MGLELPTGPSLKDQKPVIDIKCQNKINADKTSNNFFRRFLKKIRLKGPKYHLWCHP